MVLVLVIAERHWAIQTSFHLVKMTTKSTRRVLRCHMQPNTWSRHINKMGMKDGTWSRSCQSQFQFSRFDCAASRSSKTVLSFRPKGTPLGN
jgi:hypothetical protein